MRSRPTAIASPFANISPPTAAIRSGSAICLCRTARSAMSWSRKDEPKRHWQTIAKRLKLWSRLPSPVRNNIQWQADVIKYSRDLAINGDDPARRFAFIVSALRKLQILTTLTDEQKGWLAEAEKQVSKLKQSKARP